LSTGVLSKGILQTGFWTQILNVQFLKELILI